MHAEYCEIIEKLEKQLAEAKEDVRRLTGKTVDKLDEAQLEPLREELDNDVALFNSRLFSCAAFVYSKHHNVTIPTLD